MSENTRRCLTNRFPFGVIYQIVENEVVVLAVMQLNRRPNYWGERADRADDNEGET
jgi:cytochrome P450